VAQLAAGRPVTFIDASRAPVDYYLYPFEVAGGRSATASDSGWVAVSCFDAWRSTTGVIAPCGGPAESGGAGVQTCVPAGLALVEVAFVIRRTVRERYRYTSRSNRGPGTRS